MRSFLLIILISVVSLAFAQKKQEMDIKDNIPSVDHLKTEPVNIGFSLKLHSRILNEDRIVKIALPDGYDSNNKKYPVFYLVDAQWNFNLTVNAISVLASNGLIPQMIVVGINTIEKREWDLLPTRLKARNVGGGADTLLSFIKEELIPFIEKNYRTYPLRLLSGSSYGGVFVMHAFISDPQLFTGILTLSPSMWWDYGVMLKRTIDVLSKKPDLKNYLYATVANEGPGMGVDSLARILKKNAPKGLIWKFNEYPEEIHGTVCYKSTYNGLKFIFADWSNAPVNFETTGGLLNPQDSVIIKIKSNSKLVRYTLDGSVPTVSSPLYEKQIVVKKPVTLRVIPYFGIDIPGNIDSLSINYVPKLNAETNLPALKTGLKYSYYEGRWDMLPDFGKLTSVATGITSNFELHEPKIPEFYAMHYNGYIDILKDDIYTFFLLSDDGSKLFINDSLIVDNDGLHGNLEKRSQVYLQKGKHRFTVQFFQNAGGQILNIEYESSGITKRKIPSKDFYFSE